MVHSHGHIVTLLSLHPTMNYHPKSFVVGAFFGGIVGNPAEFFLSYAGRREVPFNKSIDLRFMQTVSIYVQAEQNYRKCPYSSAS